MEGIGPEQRRQATEEAIRMSVAKYVRWREMLRDRYRERRESRSREAHATRKHDALVQSIYDTADLSTNRRKRKRVPLVDPFQEHAGVSELKQKLDAVRMKSWQSV